MPAPSPVFLLLNAPPSPALDELAARLSPSSRQKFAKLHHAQRAREFLLGRWLLTTAAARLLSRPVDLDAIDDQGPFPLLPAWPQLHASISHSTSWLGVVISQDARIGLDIEHMRRRADLLALAQRAFGQEIAQALLALDDAAREEAFYRLWTWREAAYKAGLIKQVVGALANLPLASQSGRHESLFWSAVSAQAFVLAPEIIHFPAG
jgi:4'-phosphopantetheinyl transferase